MRSVYTLLSKTTALPPPLQAPLPYKDGVHPAFILLPHELFAYMWDHQDVWKRKMLSDPNKLREFWNSMDGHPAMFNHPLKDYDDFEDWCLPISMHGDEVPVFGVGKIWSRCFHFLGAPWYKMLWGVRALKSCSIFLVYLKSSPSIPTPMLLEPWNAFSKSWLGLSGPCGKGSGQVMIGEGVLSCLGQRNGSLDLLEQLFWIVLFAINIYIYMF